MIKDILTNLALRDQTDGSVVYAASVAKLFGARLVATACAFSPVYPTTTPMELLGVDFISAGRSANENLAQIAISQFKEVAIRHKIESETRVITGTVADAAKSIAGMARRFDLSILPQAKGDEWDVEQIIETVLFGSGRPLLIVPYIQRKPCSLNSVLVCWDGSQAAARAIGDALPFLIKAAKVQLITVNTGDENEAGPDDINSHLRRHGIQAEQRIVSANAKDEVNTILNAAADMDADFIVMGGYGHSRLREFVLGGVTRGILSSMTAPVLLSH